MKTDKSSVKMKNRVNLDLSFNFLFNCFQLHKKEKHNEMEYPCDKCSRVFTLQRNLDKHLCDAHFDENRYICDSCVLEFKSAEELAEHNDSMFKLVFFVLDQDQMIWDISFRFFQSVV